MGRYAWVTLATNDAYSLGALVLAHSLRRAGTKYELACLITPGVTAAMREKLAAIFSLVQEVNVLDSKDEANLALLARPELGITFTKLHCWRLTQYEKCVFVDADTLVVRNCDELFEREELSAAPDVGWPDCFNSGVFVFRPSQETFASITAFAVAKGSFDGGDQGLLNMYFSDWATKDISKHLPFIYNMCSTATYSYLPAFKRFGEEVRIIHFIGITKPWLQYFDTLTGIVQAPAGSGHLQPLLQLWWNIFCEQVHPQLSPSMATSTLAPIYDFAPLLCTPSVPKTPAYSDTNRERDFYSQAPDFSEFKDPWEEYCQRNESLSVNGGALSDVGENYYYRADQFSVVHQTDHNASPLQHNMHFHYEPQQFNEQHFSLASPQMQQQHVMHNQHVISREENCDQGYTEHYQQQQYDEPKHYDERHNEHHQYLEQRHRDEQSQPNEQSYHYEQHRYGEQTQQHSMQHRHFEEQSQQIDHYLDKVDNHQIHHQTVHEHRADEQSHSEMRQESQAQHYASNQASHQNANYSQKHIVPSNEPYSRTIQSSHVASGERSLDATNKHGDARRIDSSPSFPSSHTDFHNVAMQSDPNVTEHLDNANAGIAGALAQITLGAPRSAQQIALEEHMRKQSWEQGQIDYMGRDSFDNIWKKICETLSLAPQRQATPPKEDTPKAEEIAAAVAAVAVAAEPATEPAVETVTLLDVQMDKPAVEADKDPTGQEQPLVCKVPEKKLPAQSEENVVVVAQSLEQKTSALPAQESVATETAATKTSSEAVTTQESQDVKTKLEASSEMPSPKPSTVESLIVKQECELASPAMQETTVSTGKGLLEMSQLLVEDSKAAESQIFSCPLAVCKPPTQVGTDATVIGTKPETPASAISEIMQPVASAISIDSPQVVAASSTPIQEDIMERVIESTIDVTQPLTIDPSERHAEILLAASEISTVSPVPIQVAESVLQAEPKESLLGAAATASDQAIATTVTAVQESTDVASAITAEPIQLNGSACEIENREIVMMLPKLSEQATAFIAAAELAKESASGSTIKDVPSEVISIPEEKSSSTVTSLVISEKSEKVEKSSEQIAKTETISTEPITQIVQTVATETKSPEQIAETETQTEVKPVEQAAKIETTAEKSPEQVVKAEMVAKSDAAETKAQTETEQAKLKVEVVEAAAKVTPSKVAASPIVEQIAPTEISEAKTMSIPSTPTVIEATPPTSPSVEGVQETSDQEKAAKKSLKKSDSADGTDGEGGADKKGAKKTVKKVTKKPKLPKPEETASIAEATATATAAVAPTVAADNSQTKAKKTTKVTKKTGVKSGQSLETDTPETPLSPSSATVATTTTTTTTSEIPVPPKRKTKTTASAKGTTSKKSETEE